MPHSKGMGGLRQHLEHNFDVLESVPVTKEKFVLYLRFELKGLLTFLQKWPTYEGL